MNDRIVSKFDQKHKYNSQNTRISIHVTTTLMFGPDMHSNKVQMVIVLNVQGWIIR